MRTASENFAFDYFTLICLIASHLHWPVLAQYISICWLCCFINKYRLNHQDAALKTTSCWLSLSQLIQGQTDSLFNRRMGGTSIRN